MPARRCSVCRQPGHWAPRCPENQQPGLVAVAGTYCSGCGRMVMRGTEAFHAVCDLPLTHTPYRTEIEEDVDLDQVVVSTQSLAAETSSGGGEVASRRGYVRSVETGDWDDSGEFDIQRRVLEDL